MKIWYLGSLLLAVSAQGGDYGFDQDGIPVACQLIAQGGATDENFCRYSVSKVRCYADVVYRNERKQRWWSEDACVQWGPDCAAGANSAVRPGCLAIEDID